MKKNGLAEYVLDPLHPDPLTASERSDLEALASSRESEVDTSDIPTLTDDFWKNAVPNPFYRPMKQQITVRLDADVLAWLRAAGRGYQTKLNDILRRAMLRDVTKG